MKSIDPSKSKRRCFPKTDSRKEGFTLIELVMVMVILGILATIAIGGFRIYLQKAYKVTILHDIKKFVEAQESYFSDHQRYLGAAADFIEGGNSVTGTLDTSELKFTPSDGVRIEIISGDGSRPYEPPFYKAQASHKKTKAKYIHDFSTNLTMEMDD